MAAGRIDVCKWVRLACERHLRDLERSADPAYPYVFDEARATRATRFIEELPHVKGDWARRQPGKDNRIRLEPWQCFVVCSIFGWLHRETRYRRFRLAYICVPRKNGKSILAGGVANYMLAADGEAGAEVYTGATCERQAWEVFRPARLMVDRTPRLKELFGIRVGARNLCTPADGGRFEPLVGDPGDGSSPSCGVVDEYHEHRTDKLFDSLKTGMGARTQPLLLTITTAGSNIAGPCHSFQRDVEKVLDGAVERDELFGIIYTIDDADDWQSESALVKANPNYGVSVYAEFLRSEQKAAIASSRKQNVFKTKHLNVWVGASVSWLNMARWRALGDPALTEEDLRGARCWLAGDLSSKLDIASMVKVFRRKIDGLEHYYVFGKHYLPAERVNDPDFAHYAGWAHDGHLLTTPGNVIDYEAIADHAVADIKHYKVEEFGFDPWNAEQFAQKLARETPVIAVEIPQQVRTMSEPMKHLEALVIDGRLHHDGHPVLTWMVSNVVARLDAKGNVFPNKEKAESKIDGAVALIMALSRALVSAERKSVYATRGVRTL